MCRDCSFVEFASGIMSRFGSEGRTKGLLGGCPGDHESEDKGADDHGAEIVVCRW